jgi:hypothetical protein
MRRLEGFPFKLFFFNECEFFVVITEDVPYGTLICAIKQYLNQPDLSHYHPIDVTPRSVTSMGLVLLVFLLFNFFIYQAFKSIFGDRSCLPN